VVEADKAAEEDEEGEEDEEPASKAEPARTNGRGAEGVSSFSSEVVGNEEPAPVVEPEPVLLKSDRDRGRKHI
jgi:hypothetical protein